MIKSRNFPVKFIACSSHKKDKEPAIKYDSVKGKKENKFRILGDEERGKVGRSD